jgi:hypothetical protein
VPCRMISPFENNNIHSGLCRCQDSQAASPSFPQSYVLYGLFGRFIWPWWLPRRHKQNKNLTTTHSGLSTFLKTWQNACQLLACLIRPPSTQTEILHTDRRADRARLPSLIERPPVRTQREAGWSGSASLLFERLESRSEAVMKGKGVVEFIMTA